MKMSKADTAQYVVHTYPSNYYGLVGMQSSIWITHLTYQGMDNSAIIPEADINNIQSWSVIKMSFFYKF